MEDFDGGKAFELEARIEFLQRAEHPGVVTEGKRRMQAADDVQLGDADTESFAGHLNDFFDRVLEAIGVPFFARKSAEFAAQDAVVRVVDVAIEDVSGALAIDAFARKIGDGADGVKVFALEEPEGVLFGN